MAGFNFAGASTPWRTVNGQTTTSFGPGNSIESKAVGTARDIAGKIGALRAQAEGYAAGAYSSIDACMRFSASVPKVTFVTPTYSSAALQSGDVGGEPGVDAPASPGGVASFNPPSNTASFSSGSAGAPPVGTLPRIGDVSSDISFGAPAAPSAAGLTIAPAPSLTISIGNVPDVAAPSAPGSIELGSVDLGEVAGFSVPGLADGEITQALDRLRSMSAGAVRIPRPDLVFPQVFEVAGSLLSGDLVVDSDAVLRQSDERVRRASDRHDTAFAQIWSDRGFSVGAVAPYNAVMRARAEADALSNNTAAAGRWLDDALLAAYTVGVAAHGMMLDLEMSLDDLEFEALLAEAEARLEQGRAVVAAYNGAAAVFRARVAASEAAYVVAETEAARYRTQVDLVQEQQKLNGAIADNFKAGEQAKQAEVQLFAAKVSGNEARVSAFEAQMRAEAAKVKTLQLDAEKYKAQVLAWEAQVEQVRSQYMQSRNKARMTAAQNQAIEAGVRASGALNEAIGVQARQAAAETAASAAKLRAEIQRRSSEHAAADAKNTFEAVVPKIAVAKYEAEVMSWAAQLDQKTGMLDGVAAEMSASARFFVSASESESRAAQISQNAQQQLAEAYKTAAEAAGRAGAAVESGRLSGYRATASLNARASLGADENYALSASDNFTESVRETDSIGGEDGGEE